MLTTDPKDAPALAAALSCRLVVACLCAAWCDTCEEFRLTFARLASADPSAAVYLWIEISEQANPAPGIPQAVRRLPAALLARP